MNYNSEQYGFELNAKRKGPKSAAQTPAKPSERKKGSSRNKPGSAGTKSDKAIEFSKKIFATSITFSYGVGSPVLIGSRGPFLGFGI
jgi:hypothetical protein